MQSCLCMEFICTQVIICEKKEKTHVEKHNSDYYRDTNELGCYR
jgi:hypothetical protein